MGIYHGLHSPVVITSWLAKKMLGPGSQGPGTRDLGPRDPDPRIFFCLARAWPGKKKLKHGLALAQGQARPKWVLGSRPRPGNKIYIMYYILYIIYHIPSNSGGYKHSVHLGPARRRRASNLGHIPDQSRPGKNNA